METRSLLGHLIELGSSLHSTRTPADRIVKEFFRTRHYLGARDRRFISERFYGMLRHERLLQAYLDSAGDAYPAQSSNPVQRFVALYVAYAVRVIGEEAGQVLSDILVVQHYLAPEFDISTFVDVLRRCPDPASAEHSAVRRIAVSHSFPDFVVEEWVRRFGVSGAENLCRSLNQPAPTTIRVNILKTTLEECHSALKRERIEARRTRLSPSGLLLEKRMNAQALQSFRDGWFEVQDEGSQLIALIVDPQEGETVVDACAGGGGKSLHLAALMNNAGALFSVDVDDDRLRRFRERAGRAGVTIARTCHARRDASLLLEREERTDRVLVDAPCTGLGTARRNPWLKLRLTEQEADRLVQLQRSILERYARLVKPGGRLVYATCTLLERENEEAIAWFLSTHAEFSLLSIPELLRATGIPYTSSSPFLQLLPSETTTDGFFAAALVRQG